MKRREIQLDEIMLEVRKTGCKLRGLGHLIALQREDPPNDPAEEVFEGVGMLIEEMGAKLVELGSLIDEGRLGSAELDPDD